ncbi:MAG: hypothetical protein E7260_02570 [Lachnospiraceae bacterium]|nr:hypothetical protein [Lachnospiraceae bacterium]
MRLKGYFKGFFIFGLLLFLGITQPFMGSTTVAHADETQEIKLNVNAQTIVRGNSFSVYVYNLSENQTVSFRSSSPAVASVDQNGVVYANLVGTTTILVTISEGDSVVTVLPCRITVGPPAISIQFTKLQITLEVGESYTLKRIIQPIISVEVPRFSSYNRLIASVSAGGRVTGRTVGETYIFAQIDNGSFAACKVIVVPQGTFAAQEQAKLATSLEEGETAVPTPSSVPKSSASSTTTDPLLKNLQGISFEAFLKKLNAVGKTSENAVSETDNAN